MRKLIFLLLVFSLFASPATAQQFLWRYRTAADCTALTDGKATDLCYQTDKKLYKCVPTAGDCDTAGEWEQVSGSASAVDKVEFIISGNGSGIAASASGHKVVPFAGTITKWEITSSASGSIVADVKKATYSDLTFTSIAGTEKPTITTSTKGTDTSLSTWTTSVSAGDRIQAVIDSADIVGTVVLTIYIQRT